MNRTTIVILSLIMVKLTILQEKMKVPIVEYKSLSEEGTEQVAKDHAKLNDDLDSGEATFIIRRSGMFNIPSSYIVYKNGVEFDAHDSNMKKIAEMMLEILDGKGVHSWVVNSDGRIDTKIAYIDANGYSHSLDGWDEFLNRVLD